MAPSPTLHHPRPTRAHHFADPVLVSVVGRFSPTTHSAPPQRAIPRLAAASPRSRKGRWSPKTPRLRISTAVPFSSDNTGPHSKTPSPSPILSLPASPLYSSLHARLPVPVPDPFSVPHLSRNLRKSLLQLVLGCLGLIIAILALWSAQPATVGAADLPHLPLPAARVRQVSAWPWSPQAAEGAVVCVVQTSPDGWHRVMDVNGRMIVSATS